MTRLKHDNAWECLEEIRCFVRFGGYAMQLLPRVVDSIFAHYRVTDDAVKRRLLREAGVPVRQPCYTTS